MYSWRSRGGVSEDSWLSWLSWRKTEKIGGKWTIYCYKTQMRAI